MVIVALVLFALACAIYFYLKKDKKNLGERMANYKEYEYDTIYLADTDPDVEQKFFKECRENFEENIDYDLSAKELKEDYLGERVYRYEPYEDLPVKIEGDQVYSTYDDENWIKIGRIKKTDLKKLEGAQVDLVFYPMVWKYPTKDEILKESGDPYFSLNLKR